MEKQGTCLVLVALCWGVLGHELSLCESFGCRVAIRLSSMGNQGEASKYPVVFGVAKGHQDSSISPTCPILAQVRAELWSIMDLQCLAEPCIPV